MRYGDNCDEHDLPIDRCGYCKDNEIATLREQVEKLTKERDEWKNDAINGGNAGYLREQLAALAEQNAELHRMLNERS